MKIYTREPHTHNRFSLHDAGILAFVRDGDDLVLETDSGFVDVVRDEMVKGRIRIRNVWFSDSYVHVLHYRDVLCGNVGRFSGKKMTLADFVVEFSKNRSRMDIMGEFDGYRTVVFTGFVTTGERIAEVLMEIDYSGDFLYEIKED